MIKILKMKNFILLIILLSFTFFPGFSFAAQTRTSTGLCTLAAIPPKLGDLLNYATCLISKSVVPLIFALATASFVWGVVQYVINTTDETKKAKGKQFMIWGIVALTVMMCIWGLVGILGGTFGLSNVIPQVPVSK
jgi:zinc transporter ZupT